MGHNFYNFGGLVLALQNFIPAKFFPTSPKKIPEENGKYFWMHENCRVSSGKLASSLLTVNSIPDIVVCTVWHPHTIVSTMNALSAWLSTSHTVWRTFALNPVSMWLVVFVCCAAKSGVVAHRLTCSRCSPTIHAHHKNSYTRKSTFSKSVKTS